MRIERLIEEKMLSTSCLRLAGLLLLLFHLSEQIACPANYNHIVSGCYKVNNGSNKTWSEAQSYCANDVNNGTTSPINGTSHLAALEIAMEKTAVTRWLAAYNIPQPFWIDGLTSTLQWTWSNQSINWYLNSTERAMTGKGSNYKIQYNANASRYEIADDIASLSIPYLCEYQEFCNENNSCQNNATCYLNIGFELCLCAPGFEGEFCEMNIDECLSSPCQHGGRCTDGRNNYTCDCSAIFFTGPNCETETPDPTGSRRLAAFWSVVGVVSGLVFLLTISDLPWESIMVATGCTCKCTSEQSDRKQIQQIATHLSGSPGNDQQSTPTGVNAKGMNYHVRTAIWSPDQPTFGTPVKTQYDGYHSPPIHTNIHSMADAVLAKKKQEASGVNTSEPTGTQSVDTMFNWPRQLQDQLRNISPSATSSNSVRPLISPQ